MSSKAPFIPPGCVMYRSYRDRGGNRVASTWRMYHACFWCFMGRQGVRSCGDVVDTYGFIARRVLVWVACGRERQMRSAPMHPTLEGDAGYSQEGMRQPCRRIVQYHWQYGVYRFHRSIKAHTIMYNINIEIFVDCPSGLLGRILASTRPADFRSSWVIQ